MKLLILDALIAEKEAGEELKDLREFRRSTTSILKGAALLQRLFEKNPLLRSYADSHRLAFVVGSGVGEIEVTRDFLKELALTNTARPFLFQLSSHNSTLGFLAQHFALKGATLSVSNQFQSAESCLESAGLLLSADLCDMVIVFCCDQQIPEGINLEMYQSFPDLKAKSGAALLLLSQKDILGIKTLCELKGLSFGKETEGAKLAGDFYDSNSLEQLAQLVNSKEYGQHSMVRPDRSHTEFSIHAVT